MTSGMTANELIGVMNNEKLAMMAKQFSALCKLFSKNTSSFRKLFCKEAKQFKDGLCGFTAEECIEAIDEQLESNISRVDEKNCMDVLGKAAKTAAWKLVNTKEAQEIFAMFKRMNSKDLKCLEKNLEGLWISVSKSIKDFYNEELTIDEYITYLWENLSVNNWKALNGYKGDGSVYAWLKTIGYNQCIKAFKKLHPELEEEMAEEDLNVTAIDKKIGFERDHCYFGEDYLNADSKFHLEGDVAMSFFRDRIEEMPWEDWKKDFMIDCYINEKTPMELVDIYGLTVAKMAGKNESYDRRWVDNIKSRSRAELAKYVKAYLGDDFKQLAEFAAKREKFNKRLSVAAC